MLRVTVLGVLTLVVTPHALHAQAVSTLHIKVALTETDGTAMPVPRHTLLISDNPTTAPPRTVTTGVDGTANVKLKPGNYTIESDRPVALHGKAFQWTQTIDVVAGRDTLLELTAKNAENAGADAAVGAASVEAEPSLLLPRWQDSVVAVWTPTTRVSGFVVDAKGLIATNQKAIGTAASVEVQVGDSVKTAARVVATDASRDVAVLWVNPAGVAAAKPVPLGCAQPKSSLGDQQDVFAIGVPFRQATDMTSGTVAELRLIHGNEGGPVFTADGSFVGLSSLAATTDDGRRGSSRVVPGADVCEVVASAEKQIAGVSSPSASRLPIEPAWPMPVDAFKDAAMRRAGNLSPYQISTPMFDVAFITPIMTFGVQYQSEQMSRRTRKGKDSRTIEIEPILVRPVMDFGNWADYVIDFPPVLLVRIAPRQVEGLWNKVARGAASTQGVGLPPMTHAKAGFSRMRAYCGDKEVTPIHPFTIEHRVSDKETLSEGLYVFEPSAFSTSCGTVRFELYADKDPERPDIRVVDAAVLQQIAQDFALYKR
jgi:Trypsin-like peptidase domain